MLCGGIKLISEANISRTPKHNQRLAKMTFASVYPHYLNVEKKGRTKEELYEIIEWLTGFMKKDLDQLIKKKVTFKEFFAKVKLNKNAIRQHQSHYLWPWQSR